MELEEKLRKHALEDFGCTYCDLFYESAKEIERLRKKEKLFSKLAVDIRALIKDSYGVSGLHLNGDVAPWYELLDGGRYCEWLQSLSEIEFLEEKK